MPFCTIRVRKSCAVGQTSSCTATTRLRVGSWLSERGARMSSPHSLLVVNVAEISRTLTSKGVMRFEIKAFESQHPPTDLRICFALGPSESNPHPPFSGSLQSPLKGLVSSFKLPCFQAPRSPIRPTVRGYPGVQFPLDLRGFPCVCEHWGDRAHLLNYRMRASSSVFES